MKRATFVVLSLVIGLMLVSCGGSPSGPKAGTWNGSAEFGQFSFDMNDQQTVTRMAFKFASWKCGASAGTISGGVSFSRPSGWPMVEHSFQFSTVISASQVSVSMDGTFSADGTKASGNWKATGSEDATISCSGTWEASAGGTSAN